MIERKIWTGDMLNLAAGNSFWCDEVVSHRAGYATAIKDSEIGDPLVEVNGGYTVKRSDLFELSDKQVHAARLSAEIAYAGLRGNSREDCDHYRAELRELTGE